MNSEPEVSNILSNAIPNWLQVILLFATLLFSIWLAWARSKHARIEYWSKADHTNDHFHVLVTNTSTSRDIEIDKCGFVNWNGEDYSKAHWFQRDDYLLHPERSRGFFFEEDNGVQSRVLDLNQIYYFYAEDVAGKVYRKYTRSRWIAWPKRFLNWYFKFLGL